MASAASKAKRAKSSALRRNSKHEWRIGETTDDTERTIAVARAIIRDRRVSHESIGREMLGCRKCVHPGVKSLWEFHQANDPVRVATRHDGCGAAIVAPVGIFQSRVTSSPEASSARGIPRRSTTSWYSVVRSGQRPRS